MNKQLYIGNCLDVLKRLPENSMDSVVTDPPYELSNDGNASAARVFFEFMFPNNAKIETIAPGKDNLLFLVQKISELSCIDRHPRETTSMPISAVTFNNHTQCRNDDIVNTCKSTIDVTDCDGLKNSESENTEHLGDFILELADSTFLLNLLNSIGAGFCSGGLRIGFRIPSSGFPCAMHSGCSVIFSDNDIRARNSALAHMVSTFSRTTNDAMFGFDMGRRAIEVFSANGASIFMAVLLSSGAKLIRTSATTSGLPTMLESRSIRIIDTITNNALSFNLIVRPHDVNSVGFMGKKWDGTKISFNVELWQEVLRVLKPGGHLLSFGGTRTYHRLVCAVEDAGFEIRDQVQWLYGSGFPKSLDVSKAIDKAAGQQRGSDYGPNFKNVIFGNGMGGGKHVATSEPPVTDAAKQWQGWGTALKPAFEPIVLARKPLVGTVANNVMEYGTGAMNIDGCRVPLQDGEDISVMRNGDREIDTQKA